MILRTNKYDIKLLPKFYEDYEAICLKLKDEFKENYISRIELLINPYVNMIEAVQIKSTKLKGYTQNHICLWLLIKTNSNNKSDLLKYLDKFEAVNPQYPINHNIALLISTIPKIKHIGISNIIGSIYQFVDNRKNKNQLLFLEYAIFNGMVQQAVKTFSTYESAKYYIKEKNKEVTKYTFKDGFLNISNENRKDNLILTSKNSKEDERNNVEFFRTGQTIDEISGTRSYYMYKFVNDIKKYLSEYIEINQELLNSNQYKYSNLNNSNISLFEKQAYNIINLSLNEDEDIKHQLMECLKKSYPNNSFNIKIGEKLSSSKINFIIVNRKEEYEKAKLKDRHVKNSKYITQHIYYDQVIQAFNSLGNKKEWMKGKVLLTEAHIKYEIKQRELMMFDMSNNMFEDAEFILPTKDKNKEVIYFSLRINGNNLIFSRVDSSEINIKYNFNHEGYIRLKGKKIMVIVDDGHIVLPNMPYVVERLEIIEKFGRVNIEDFLKTLKDFHNTNKYEYNIKKSTFLNDAITEIKNNLNNLYTLDISAGQIREVLQPFKKTKSYGFYGGFIEFYYKKYNKLIAPLLDNTVHKVNYLEGFSEINYYMKDSKLFYSAGYPEIKDINRSVARALRIKNVSNFEEAYMDDYFKLLDVSFVRHKQSTVVPFPFKYLREFVKAQKDLY